MMIGLALLLTVAAFFAGRAGKNTATASTSSAAAHPECARFLSFDPPEVDIGPQPWGLEVPFTVTLRNDTESTATLRGITPSCGCTVIDGSQYAGAEVAAGDILDIVGTVDVGTVLGPHRKQIDVLLDGGSVRSVFVRFDTFATYDASPRDLAFGDVDLQHQEDRILSVLFVSDSAKVLSAQTDVPWVDAALREAASGRFEIAARLTPALLPPGPSFGRVLVRTDDPSRPTFSVPVHANGLAKLMAAPRHLFLRPGERRLQSTHGGDVCRRK